MKWILNYPVYETMHIWDNAHMRPCTYETMHIWDHVHIRPCTYVMTSASFIFSGWLKKINYNVTQYFNSAGSIVNAINRNMHAFISCVRQLTIVGTHNFLIGACVQLLRLRLNSWREHFGQNRVELSKLTRARRQSMVGNYYSIGKHKYTKVFDLKSNLEMYPGRQKT